jgi:hypothetical protein
MNDMNIRIYYNHLYDDYKKYCFLLYIESLGIFISTTNDLFTSIEKSDVIIDNGTIDAYAMSRGFTKLLETYFRENMVSWIDDGYNKRDDLVSTLTNAKTSIKDHYKYTVNGKVPKLSYTLYSVVNCLLNRIK